MSELIIYYKGQPILRETLAGSLTIGNGSENDIRLIDSVATNHARVEVTTKAVVLVERDGVVFLNGQKVTGASPIEDGDAFEIGAYRIQLVRSSLNLNLMIPNQTTTASVVDGGEVKDHIIPILQFLSPIKRRFRRPRIFIGRDSGNDIVIPDPYLSAQHAEIFVHRGMYFVRDLHSRNGTFVNDIPITEKELPSTGNIRLGRYSLTYQVGTPASYPQEEFEGFRIPGPIPKSPDRMIVGQSSAFQSLMKKLKSIAPSNDSVMLVGETGVGKDLLAHYLHNEHPKRRTQPLIIVNCATIPPALAESQLFGHVRGAFTGAVNDHKGFFQQANGGTLFLDEISELTIGMQASLLRVMEEGLVRPVSDTRQIPVDVRLVAATNRDLRADCKKEAFRQDLFERFEWIIQVPPLRDRLDDLPLLVHYFIHQHAPVPLSVGSEVITFLQSLPWPGNLRGLNKAVRRAITCAVTRNSNQLTISDFEELVSPEVESEEKPLPPEMKKMKRSLLMETLKSHKGKIQRVARALNVSRQTIYTWLKEEGIDPESMREQDNDGGGTNPAVPTNNKF